MLLSLFPYKLPKAFLSVLLLYLISIGTIYSQVSFQATADAQQVIIGGSFTVNYTLKNASPTNFKVPSFRNFLILSGPNQSSSMSIINGRSTQEVSYSYVLQPKKIGTYTLPSATIYANGKSFTSNTIRIEVLKGKNNATSQKEIDQNISDQVFIKIIPNTTEARIGQQVVLDYKLFTKLSINQYKFLKEADYAGFFAHEMRQFNNRPIQEVIDGEQYSTLIIKRVALFPQQAGQITIDPAQLRVYILTGKQPTRRTFFSRPQTKPYDLITESLKINVFPLPDDPPETFTGAVGKYTISSLIEKNRLSTDDAVAIRMTIQGNGDVKQIQAPPLVLDDNFEVYDPKIIDEVTYESQQTLFSRKEIEYLVLPKKAGNFRIQPQFTYFDTDSLRYITLLTRTHPLVVSKGTNKTTNIISPEENDIGETDIRFIHLNTSLGQVSSSLFGTPIYWILLSFPFLVLGGAFVYKRMEVARLGIDPVLLKRRQAQKQAQKRLKTAALFLNKGDSREFYDEVSRAMLGYVCDKLDIQTADLTKDNVTEKLKLLQVKEDHIAQFLDIIKNCEIALFAGMDNSAAMQSTYANALEVVTNIETDLM